MLRTKKGTWAIGIGVAVLLLLTGGAYAASLSRLNRPEAAFWQALESGINTPGLTCASRTTEQGLTTEQTVSLDLLSKSNLRARTTLSKSGSTVSTETIVTKTDQYVRYTAITLPSGGSKDFSQVINVWSRLPRADTDAAPLYDKTVLGGCIVPLADLPRDQRNQAMRSMRDLGIFKTDFGKARFRYSLTSPTLIYDVAVPPDMYVLYMQDMGKRLGLKGLEELDSSPYMKKGAAPAKLTFTVDARTQRLRSIVIQQSGANFTFGSYGKLPDTTPPKATVTSAELQKRLKAVRQ